MDFSAGPIRSHSDRSPLGPLDSKALPGLFSTSADEAVSSAQGLSESVDLLAASIGGQSLSSDRITAHSPRQPSSPQSLGPSIGSPEPLSPSGRSPPSGEGAGSWRPGGPPLASPLPDEAWRVPPLSDALRVFPLHHLAPVDFLQEPIDSITPMPDALAVNQSRLDGALVVHVLSARLPFQRLLSSLRRQWFRFGPCELISSAPTSLVYLFPNAECRDAVVRAGPWFVGHKFIGMDRWCPFPGGLFSVVWVRLPHLPLLFWDRVHIARLASIIGEPLWLDESTAAWGSSSFVRFAVRLSITGPLRTGVAVVGPTGRFFQAFVYEGLAIFCPHCCSVDHSVDSCSLAREAFAATGPAQSPPGPIFSRGQPVRPVTPQRPPVGFVSVLPTSPPNRLRRRIDRFGGDFVPSRILIEFGCWTMVSLWYSNWVNWSNGAFISLTAVNCYFWMPPPSDGPSRYTTSYPVLILLGLWICLIICTFAFFLLFGTQKLWGGALISLVLLSLLLLSECAFSSRVMAGGDGGSPPRRRSRGGGGRSRPSTGLGSVLCPRPASPANHRPDCSGDLTGDSLSPPRRRRSRSGGVGSRSRVGPPLAGESIASSLEAIPPPFGGRSVPIGPRPEVLNLRVPPVITLPFQPSDGLPRHLDSPGSPLIPGAVAESVPVASASLLPPLPSEVVPSYDMEVERSSVPPPVSFAAVLDRYEGTGQPSSSPPAAQASPFSPSRSYRTSLRAGCPVGSVLPAAVNS
ncbi:hypothetical protein M5K25_009020 [Dendrobium thyrsiflorum]|uniref:DUF4283 domain-containing protein n=1 Tax=Dendrobium thyrsiflorum TaxID=117978 RepID=A0ABD0V4U1_DENTH